MGNEIISSNNIHDLSEQVDTTVYILGNGYNGDILLSSTKREADLFSARDVIATILYN